MKNTVAAWFAIVSISLVSPVLAQSNTAQPPQKTPQSDAAQEPQKMSKSDIAKVQQALQKEGYNPGSTNGDWGPESEQALKQFQANRALPSSNGQIDANTLGALHLSRMAQAR